MGADIKGRAAIISWHSYRYGQENLALVGEGNQVAAREGGPLGYWPDDFAGTAARR